MHASFAYDRVMTIHKFQRHILDWYRKNRRDMPWRRTHDPYKILVSEVMLQQTQVSRVLQKYKEFLKAYPTMKSLARSHDKKLLRVWSGLGYWRRAKLLKETAKIVMKKYQGRFPANTSELRALPGIGPYTAGALACFAFGSDEPFIDTNIRRVYLHFFFPTKIDVSDTAIMDIAKKAIWKKDPPEWHYALFDYGATVLKDKKINLRSKHYTKQSPFEGSFRSFRTKVVKVLLAAPYARLSKSSVLDFLDNQLRMEERDWPPQEIVNALLADGIIKKTRDYYHL